MLPATDDIAALRSCTRGSGSLVAGVVQEGLVSVSWHAEVLCSFWEKMRGV